MYEQKVFNALSIIIKLRVATTMNTQVSTRRLQAGILHPSSIAGYRSFSGVDPLIAQWPPN